MLLQRYSILGWILFGITFAVASVGGLFSILKPVPVVVVNPQGQVMGEILGLDATYRSDEELLPTSKRFLDYYLSLNSETIYDDYAAALGMMDDEFGAKWLDGVKKNNTLVQIEKAQQRSHLELTKSQIEWRKDNKTAVRLQGSIVLGGNKELPFDTTVTMRILPRTQLNTAGVKVTAVEDN